MTEWNASEYQRHSTLQETMANVVLSRLTLRGDERALDVGCGDGKITAAIAARLSHGSIVGIDPSRDMIAFSSRRFPPGEHPNLRFEVGDARSIPFRQEFDLAVSFNALHWVHEQHAALTSLHAALKPGGRAVLRFVPESARPSLEDVTEQVRQGPRWAGYFHGFSRPHAHFTPAEYQALAERAGFRVQGIEDHAGAWDFGSREAFAGWCRATFVAWIRNLPAEMHEPFISEVLDAYRPIAADTPQEANTFKFHQMDVELVV